MFSSMTSVNDEVAPDMVISVKETTVLSVFHPDAEDLFNTCSDLKKVAWELSDPTCRLNAEVCTVAIRPSRELRFMATTGQSHPVVPLIRAHAMQATETQARRVRQGYGGSRVPHRRKTGRGTDATAQARQRVFLLFEVRMNDCVPPDQLFMRAIEKERIIRTSTERT
jgi:hypothetical protein